MMREEAMQFNVVSRRTEAVTVKQLHAEIDTCLQLLKNQPSDTPDAWVTLLESLITHTEVIRDITGALSQEHGDATF